MKPEIEPKSPTWLAVEELALSKLERLRLTNDGTGNTEVETAVIRGRIAVWKELLALVKAPAMDADDSSHGF